MGGWPGAAGIPVPDETAGDPAMPAGTYGERARAAAGLPAVDTIPGKHFPQEDQAAAIAERIAAIAAA
jgi:hypothetical protein